MTTRPMRTLCAIPQLVFFLLAGCSEPPPLPGYEPDPELVATAADPSLIVELPNQPGVRAPVNLALMLVREGEPAGTAERVANSVSGSIAGGIRDLGIYQLQLPTRSIKQLDAALATLVANPAVVTAGYDLVMEYRECPAQSDVDALLFPDSCAWDTAHECTVVCAQVGLHPSTYGSKATFDVDGALRVEAARIFEADLPAVVVVDLVVRQHMFASEELFRARDSSREASNSPTREQLFLSFG